MTSNTEMVTTAPDRQYKRGILAAVDPDYGQDARFKHDVALVGLGYVGLPTLLAFHAADRAVLGVEVSAARLAAIHSERVDLVDSDRRRLREALNGADMELTDDPRRIASARSVIIAVPTPLDDRLLPDLTILRAACASVVANAVRDQVIILTSTSYVGCTRDFLITPLAERGLVAGRDVFVAFSPERIDPGNDTHAHEDVARVVGGATDACTRRATDVLEAYVRIVHRVSSAFAAEMTKLFENSFRAVNIAFANEFADISRALGLDALEVVQAAATKPYGFMPFYPGPGVGGHCIPCDPHYLLWQLRSTRQPTPVIEQAMAAIAARPLRVVERVREVLSLNGHGLKGVKVLVIGVAYKPDVADDRESPALEILLRLRDIGADVAFYDPLIDAVRLHDGSVMMSVVDPARHDADLVVVHTMHRCIDLTWLVDARLILDTTYRLGDIPQRYSL